MVIVIHHQLIPTHISKGFLKLNTVKTTDKKGRFDRFSVICK